MTQHSQHHKLLKNKKGYSGILAAIFIVLIALFLYSNVYMFILDRNTAYEDTASQAQQMSIDRNTELVTLSNIETQITGNRIEVSCNINNNGSLSAQILRLWVKDATINTYASIDIRDQNYNLQPGSSRPFLESVTLDNVASENDEIALWFITARGNLATFYPNTATQQVSAREIGSIIMDWTTFRYYDFGTSPPQNNQALPTPQEGCTIPVGTRGRYIMIGAVFTNLDPLGRTFTLTPETCTWAVNPRSSTSGALKEEFLWPIAKVDVNGKYRTNFDEQTLFPNQPTMVYFFDRTQDVQANQDILSLNIIFYAETETSTYGQNIPFVALKFTETEPDRSMPTPSPATINPTSELNKESTTISTPDQSFTVSVSNTAIHAENLPTSTNPPKVTKVSRR